MARYKFQGTWTDGNGRRIDSATVSVYLAGTTTVASVYAAEAGGSPVNSVTTDTSGYYSFWIDDGDYTNAQLFKTIMSKANFQSKTIDDIAVIQNPNVVDTLNNQTIAGVKTSTSTRILSSATPTDRFTETDGDADNKTWENVIVGEQYRFRVVNDALDIFGNVYTVDRTGTTVDTVNLKPTNLQHNSVKVPTISSTDTLSNKTLNNPTIDNGITLTGDSWPSFSVNRSSGTDQVNISGIDKIEFNGEVFDTNSDFDSATNFRFTPTVAGKYLLSVSVTWLSATVTLGDQLSLYIYKNGAAYAHNFTAAATSNDNETQTLTVVVDANGSTDYFEVFASNADRNTSDVEGDITRTYWTGCRIG
jgi:hypothetical protein